VKKGLFIIALLALGMVNYSAGQCVTLKNGIIQYSPGHYLAGQLITPGFDEYGYNYQAHLFNGCYANAYLGGAGFPAYTGDDDSYFALPYFDQFPTQLAAVQSHWAWPYRDVAVSMKWNDDWLANKDCDGDGSLDRHFGCASYIGSGAWETNHQSGTYEMDGKEYHWTYFVKIIAAPSDATLVEDVWYAANGKEIGPAIWGEFAIIEEVYNDPGEHVHGIQYKSPARAGLGNWDH
jgi:hypothetical protein